jgi:hypothetical protein
MFLPELKPPLLAARIFNRRSVISMQDAIAVPQHSSVPLNPSLDPVLVFFRHA